jgi:hypothetical protein
LRTARVVLARAGPIALLAVLLATLVGSSSLLDLLPFAWTPFPLGAYAAGALLLALLPSLLSARSPVPAALAIVVPILALAAYDESHLDWLRTLKNFGVTHPGAVGLARLALSFAALVLVWALHAADTAARLRASAIERGIPPAQARAAARASLRRTVAIGAAAAGASALIAGAALLAQRIDARLLLGGRASAAVPLVAIALVAGATLLVAAGRKEAA